MDSNEIKEHWKGWAKEFATDLRATTKSQTIKKLEVAALHRAIQKTGPNDMADKNILEVGCGNGHNCFMLSELLPAANFTGVDYVPDMIANAEKLKNTYQAKYARVKFFTGDILDLEKNQNIDPKYDVVFTDRCIINLNTIDLQLKAVDQLIKKVRPNGHLIILENFQQNYARQNDCRASAGLPARTPPAYNLFLDENVFVSHVEKSMKLTATDDFGSLHDLLLYSLIPMVNNGEVDYGHPLVRAAADFSISLAGKHDNPFGSFGQNRLLMFRKL